MHQTFWLKPNLPFKAAFIIWCLTDLPKKKKEKKKFEVGDRQSCSTGERGGLWLVQKERAVIQFPSLALPEEALHLQLIHSRPFQLTGGVTQTINDPKIELIFRREGGARLLKKQTSELQQRTARMFDNLGWNSCRWKEQNKTKRSQHFEQMHAAHRWNDSARWGNLATHAECRGTARIKFSFLSHWE